MHFIIGVYVVFIFSVTMHIYENKDHSFMQLCDFEYKKRGQINLIHVELSAKNDDSISTKMIENTLEND
jgi:hypothetical protein